MNICEFTTKPDTQGITSQVLIDHNLVFLAKNDYILKSSYSLFSFSAPAAGPIRLNRSGQQRFQGPGGSWEAEHSKKNWTGIWRPGSTTSWVKSSASVATEHVWFKQEFPQKFKSCLITQASTILQLLNLQTSFTV